MHVSCLELAIGEIVELAPLKGLCSPFELSGNGLPVFEYVMFEKSIMEFVRVRVEVSRPERIQFRTTISSTTAPERHGEVIETVARYKAPFHLLARHLYRYFPLYVLPVKRLGGRNPYGNLRQSKEGTSETQEVI
jgi:hypothetical protein